MVEKVIYDETLGELRRRGETLSGAVLLAGEQLPILISSTLKHPTEQELREVLPIAGKVWQKMTSVVVDRIRRGVADEITRDDVGQSADFNKVTTVTNDLALQKLEFHPYSVILSWVSPTHFPGHVITAHCSEGLDIEEVIVQEVR